MKFYMHNRRALMFFGCLMLMLSASMLVMGCGVPTFLTDLEAIVPIASAAITGIIGIIAGLTGNVELAAVAAAIGVVTTKLEAELTDVNELITEYKSNPSDTLLENIEAGLNLVVGDLNTLLTTAGLPASIASKIQAVAQAVLEQVEALLSVIPILKGSTAGQPVPNVVKPVTAKAFKSQISAALAK